MRDCDPNNGRNYRKGNNCQDNVGLAVHQKPDGSMCAAFSPTLYNDRVDEPCIRNSAALTPDVRSVVWNNRAFMYEYDYFIDPDKGASLTSLSNLDQSWLLITFSILFLFH